MSQTIVDADRLNSLPNRVRRQRDWLDKLTQVKNDLKNVLQEGKREGFI